MSSSTSNILNQVFDDYQTFSCMRKVPYATQELAHRASVAISRKGWGHVFPYKCEFCGNWHVGHKIKVLKTVRSGVRSSSSGSESSTGLEGALGERIMQAIQQQTRPSWLKFVRRVSARVSEWEISIRSMKKFRIRYKQGIKKSCIVRCLEDGGDL